MEAPILVCEAEHKACANDSFGNSELHKNFAGLKAIQMIEDFKYVVQCGHGC